MQLRASRIKMTQAFAYVLATCVGVRVVSSGLYVAQVAPDTRVTPW